MLAQALDAQCVLVTAGLPGISYLRQGGQIFLGGMAAEEGGGGGGLGEGGVSSFGDLGGKIALGKR